MTDFTFLKKNLHTPNNTKENKTIEIFSSLKPNSLTLTSPSPTLFFASIGITSPILVDLLFYKLLQLTLLIPGF